MVTVARYWPVGQTAEQTIELDPLVMSAHLASDWLPEFPPLRGRLLMGWPLLLTEEYTVSGTIHCLAIRQQVGRTERQWKGFLSWMAGICGTRQVLAKTGYDWVVPASAFYPELQQHVWVPANHYGVVTSQLRIRGKASSTSNLRPDYIAIGRLAGSSALQCAIVESKGTYDALQNRVTCPRLWRDQVENSELKYDGIIFKPQREVVIGVRANPNAKFVTTRTFQIRAWNHLDPSSQPPDAIAIEVATVALHALCLNLGWRAMANSLAIASYLSSSRAVDVKTDEPKRELKRQLEAADAELARSDSHSDGQHGWTAAYLQVDADPTPLDVQLMAETVTLTRFLASTTGPTRKAGFLALEDKLRVALATQPEPKERARRFVPPGIRVSVSSQSDSLRLAPGS